VAEVFPAAFWWRFSDKRLAMELRHLTATVRSSDEELAKRQRCLSALDNLAWHSRSRAALLTPSVGALDLLQHLSFSPDLDARDAPLRSLALNALNKMALSNRQALYKAGVIQKIVQLTRWQMSTAAPALRDDKESEEEEMKQKVLVCAANILLTYANDKTFRALLALGGPNACGDDGSTALDVMLALLNDTRFNLSVRGSAGMALMKLCEVCRRGEESWRMVHRKVIESNTVRGLVLLLRQHRKEEEEEEEEDLDDAAFSNKAIVLDVLYALSNLDSFENEVDSGEVSDRIIKAGGCLIACNLIHQLANQATDASFAASSQEEKKEEEKHHHDEKKEEVIAKTSLQLERMDLRAKSRVEVIRSAISLISSMSFVTVNRKPITTAGATEAIVAGIKACGGDHNAISYGCRALYMLDKAQVTYKVKEKNESEDQTGSERPLVESKQKCLDQASSEEERKLFERERARLESYAEELIPVLMDAIRKSRPATVVYPSNEAYMLRHICLLFFLFSSIPTIRRTHHITKWRD